MREKVNESGETAREWLIERLQKRYHNKSHPLFMSIALASFNLK